MEAQEDAGWPSGAASPLAALTTPFAVDLWSLAASLYEMATSVPLFAHSYDRVTTTSRAEMIGWSGLSATQIKQLELQHGRADVAPLVDLLRWSLDADPSNRPSSIDEVLNHAFFNPSGGTLREDFAVQRLRELIADRSATRQCCKVMVSYSWDDSNFVLGKLAPELAVNCAELWLDRLGGEHGMGEWAVESMQRGVSGADVVIAVVSPAYTQSVNCGLEMEMAVATGTPVVPVVLGVPFADWPPATVGQAQMTKQFMLPNGDLKIFVDMSEAGSFHTKLNRELLPRLKVQPTQQSTSKLGSDRAACDVAPPGAKPTSKQPSRPRRPQQKAAHNAIVPMADHVDGADTFRAIPVPRADEKSSVHSVDRGLCSECGKPVLTTQHRLANDNGTYRHDPCE